MDTVKKHYADITAAGFGRGPTVAIDNEKDAVKKTLDAHGIAFSTFEITSVTMGGKELKSDPENRSPRRYVGIDKLYTREEVIKELQDSVYSYFTGDPELDMMNEENIRNIVEIFKQDPADTAYITGLERPGEFIRLSQGEKVFDRKGGQLWPAKEPEPETPAVKVEVTKPSDKKRWTLKP